MQMQSGSSKYPALSTTVRPTVQLRPGRVRVLNAIGERDEQTLGRCEQWLATGNEDQTARLRNLAAADHPLIQPCCRRHTKWEVCHSAQDGRWAVLNSTEYRTSPFSPHGNRFVSCSNDTRLYHVRLEDLIPRRAINNKMARSLATVGMECCSPVRNNYERQSEKKSCLSSAVAA